MARVHGFPDPRCLALAVCCLLAPMLGAQITGSLSPSLGDSTVSTLSGTTAQNGLDTTFEPSADLDSPDQKAGVSDPYGTYLELSSMSSLFDPVVNEAAAGGDYTGYISPLSDAMATVRLDDRFGSGQRTLVFAPGAVEFGLRGTGANFTLTAGFGSPGASSGSSSSRSGFVAHRSSFVAYADMGAVGGPSLDAGSVPTAQPVGFPDQVATAQSIAAPAQLSVATAAQSTAVEAPAGTDPAGIEPTSLEPGLQTPLQQATAYQMAGFAADDEFQHEDGLPATPTPGLGPFNAVAGVSGTATAASGALTATHGFADSTRGSDGLSAADAGYLQAGLAPLEGTPFPAVSEGSVFAAHAYLVPNLHAAASADPPRTSAASFENFDRKYKRQRNLYGTAQQDLGETIDRERKDYRAMRSGHHELHDMLESRGPLSGRFALETGWSTPEQ